MEVGLIGFNTFTCPQVTHIQPTTNEQAKLGNPLNIHIYVYIYMYIYIYVDV